ncbi:MAG: hypothetical protein FD165_543 [Gammaproteobacteria bacterium]|nr:MAG: hypothetical protein FD165_543 [Gammaproteobacteria bacterium]TND02195.1 MAG: hypothetical protein FD120_2359 [Gammaproteobacteria bacterium]
MTTQHHPESVGAPDPELRTSPIMEEMDEDREVLAQEAEDTGVCYFNDIAYTLGNYVCTGSGELLRCDGGMWVQVGSCDPDNP